MCPEQAWPEGCAKTGLVCSFRTWLTGLGPAQIIHSNKAWPKVPVWKLQGKSCFVRAGVLWTEYLPLLFHPCWQADSSGGPTPQGQIEPLWSSHPLRFGWRHPQRAELVQHRGLQAHLPWITAVCSSFAFCLKLQTSVMAKLWAAGHVEILRVTSSASP